MTSAGLGATSAPTTPTIWARQKVRRSSSVMRTRPIPRSSTRGGTRLSGAAPCRASPAPSPGRRAPTAARAPRKRDRAAPQLDQLSQQRGRGLQAHLRTGGAHVLLELQARESRQYRRVLQRSGHRVFAKPQPARRAGRRTTAGRPSRRCRNRWCAYRRWARPIVGFDGRAGADRGEKPRHLRACQYETFLVLDGLDGFGDATHVIPPRVGKLGSGQLQTECRPRWGRVPTFDGLPVRGCYRRVIRGPSCGLPRPRTVARAARKGEQFAPPGRTNVRAGARRRARAARAGRRR